MTATVDRYELAPGLSVSRLITGMWQIADMERDGRTFDREAAIAAMARAVEAGFTTFDMADHYGSAEDVAGAFRRAHEDAANRAQLLTKWVPPPGPVSRNDVRAAVERARARLGTERVDLLQFHAWSYPDPSWLDALFALDELRREGLIDRLGVTNLDAAHLNVARASGIELVSNQVSYSLLDRRASGAMSEMCARHDVKLLAFGTLAGGFLSERWLDADEPAAEALTTWSQMKYRRFIDIAGGWPALQRLLRALARVAERHGVSIANVACRWVLEQPAVGAIIVGARLGESEHLDDNLRLFGFALDEDDHAEISEVLETLAPIPGDCGDEYRREPFLTASGDLSHHLDAIPPPYRARRRGDDRTVVSSGTPWETMAGYSRAVRRGDRVSVSGTTATHGDRLIGGGDAAAQTHFVIDKIEGALLSLGASLADVVRTRVFVARLEDWEAVARAHGQRFADVLPANTLVQAALIGDEHLVEIEAEAIVSSREKGGTS